MTVHIGYTVYLYCASYSHFIGNMQNLYSIFFFSFHQMMKELDFHWRMRLNICPYQTTRNLKKTWVQNVLHDFWTSYVFWDDPDPDPGDGDVDGNGAVLHYVSRAPPCQTSAPTWGMRSDWENQDGWQGPQTALRYDETDATQAVEDSDVELATTVTNIRSLPVSRGVLVLWWDWFPYARIRSKVAYWLPSIDAIESGMVVVI